MAENETNSVPDSQYRGLVTYREVVRDFGFLLDFFRHKASDYAGDDADKYTTVVYKEPISKVTVPKVEDDEPRVSPATTSTTPTPSPATTGRGGEWTPAGWPDAKEISGGAAGWPNAKENSGGSAGWPNAKENSGGAAGWPDLGQIFGGAAGWPDLGQIFSPPKPQGDAPKPKNQ